MEKNLLNFSWAKIRISLATVIIIIIIFLFAGTGMVCWIEKTRLDNLILTPSTFKTPLPQKNKDNLDLNKGWQIYHNKEYKEYGFEFKYPFEYNSYQKCKLTEFAYDKPPYQQIVVNLGNIAFWSAKSEYSESKAKGRTLSEYVDNFIEMFIKDAKNSNSAWQGAYEDKRSELTIDGEKAIKVVLKLQKSVNSLSGGEFIFFWHSCSELVYGISLFYQPSCAFELLDKNISEEKIFPQIITSFKFIETKNNISVPNENLFYLNDSDMF